MGALQLGIPRTVLLHLQSFGEDVLHLCKMNSNEMPLSGFLYNGCNGGEGENLVANAEEADGSLHGMIEFLKKLQFCRELIMCHFLHDYLAAALLLLP